ncbi:immunoglobulin E-set [Entophlyctis helioformis]|nr:immunoglobulin E-set [Entophlyctis helioformis]
MADGRVASGFRINSMAMSDGDTGRLMWECRDWDNAGGADGVQQASIPQAILECRSLIEHLRLHQRVLLDDECIEDWHFDFGFVIPGSTNTWQTEILAAPPDEMLPAEILSGRLVIETLFMDGTTLINRSRVRITYTQ